MQPSSSYYDYWPSSPLQRPVLIGGPDLRLTRRGAFSVSSLNGYPLTLVEDLMRHRAGLSAEELRQELGSTVYNEVCTTIVTQALRESSPHVIALPAAWVPSGSTSFDGTTSIALYYNASSSLDSDENLARFDRWADGVISVPSRIGDSALSTRILEAIEQAR